MNATTAAGARADLIKYGRILAAAYPEILAAVQITEARFDYLERVEAAAAAVVEAADREGVVEHAAAGRTLDALAQALEGRTAGS